MTQDVAVSFEFFPPKTAAMEESLWRTVLALEPLRPRFVSVTYGAGGTTRERTHATVRRIRQETSLDPAAHLTCVGADKAEIDAIADDYWAAGVRHIVALRGDPPQGATQYVPHPGGYAYAVDLVAGLRARHPFEISVAAYPETHPEALSADADLDHLKRKIDAGATRAISQYFFDTAVFARFLERARKAGITADITPGVLPIVNFAQVMKFSAACGASIPDSLKARFEAVADDPVARAAVSEAFACEQAQELKDLGCDSVHIYTLNRAELTIAICRALGLEIA